MSTVLDTYSPAERSEILRQYRNLIEVWHTRKDTADRWMVRKAFRLAVDAHKDMRRKSGEPYIYHPIEVATIAAGELGLGRTSIICALLHDVVEDTEYKLEDISAMFGEHIARIIDGLTKIESMVEDSEVESMQAENYRKILLTLSFDVRVILIKLADRLHNMRTLDAMPQHKQLKIASETLFFYAPLAYRLGLYAIKSELEDLGLKYIEPSTYSTIQKNLEESRGRRNALIEDFLVPIKKELEKQNLNVQISTVEKNISSIWEKMKAEEIPFADVYDTYALRFVIDCPIEIETSECWRIYAVITALYRPNNTRLRDWISLPKANGYESLHTTVMSHRGRWVDVQIRSTRMDEIAEKGYAAYWKYKSSAGSESGLEEWLTKVQEVLSTHEATAVEFVNDFRLSLFTDEIHVFTPKGDMITLPKGATALDFAFYIHTKLGEQCIGANVNHKLVELNHVLHSGDQVQIISSKVQVPKEEWFDFVKTARAKSRLREAIKEYRKRYRDKGEEKLKNYFKQLNIENSKANYNRLIELEKLSGLVDLYYYVAIDRINFQRVRQIFKEKSGGSGFLKFFSNPFFRSKSSDDHGLEAAAKAVDQSLGADVVREDALDLEYIVSNCCNPIHGDDVVALSFPGEPMQIHRVNCSKAVQLMSQYGNHIVKAKWKQKEDIVFLAGLRIQGYDSVGFMHRITDVVSVNLDLNIRNLQLESSNGVVTVFMTVYVRNIQNLNDAIALLQKVDGVRAVTRIDRLSDIEK